MSPNVLIRPPILGEAADFREECQLLYELLANVDEAFWDRPTLFKGWTAYDVIGHLNMFDRAAAVALGGAEALAAFTAGYRAAVSQGSGAVAYTRAWIGELRGADLLDRWRRYADRLADLYRGVDPRRRVPWGAGPGMSARSCISARQMETWAHGQAVFDLAGVVRPESDRIRNIVAIGVNTFDWSFRNRGLAAPDQPPFIQLTAPSGALWTWNDPAAPSSVSGSAVEFCQVVAQTRNALDTGLRLQGDAAVAWMAIAQCFAGRPHDPPPAGSRRPEPGSRP